MPALTDFAENETLKWLIGASPTAPVGQLKVALVTTASTDSAAGTEVTGGGYGRQNISFGAVANGQVANSAVVRFDNMPDVPYTNGAPEGANGGVRGFEIWDSAATPKRWWYAPLTTPRGYAAGDAAEFPVGELVLAID
jgi:hypothetical protein